MGESGPVERLDNVLSELEGDERERSLVVLNRTEPEPVQRLLRGAFSGQSVTVAERVEPGGDSDVVCLVDDEEVVATSDLSAVMESFLLVNSDRQVTGTADLNGHRVPDVLTGLDGTVFTLRGYPASNKEKLLLIVISRFIERRALETGAGRLRATFQRLGRIDDELGTREAYARLGGTAVETHVYGVGEADDVSLEGVVAHAGDHEGYRRSWCVSFVPPGDGNDDAPGELVDRPPRSRDEPGHAALVALEEETGVWRAAWSFRRSVVEAVDRVLETEF